MEAAAVLERDSANEVASRALDAIEGLTPDAFLDPAARTVFGATMKLILTEDGVSWPLVLAQLRRQRAGERCMRLVAEKLAVTSPILTAVPRSVRELKWAARRRQLFAVIREAGSTILEETEPSEVESALARLTTLTESSEGRSGRDIDVRAFVTFDDKPTEWVIPELLAVGERVILTGGEGGGKSTFIRQLAVQTAAGIHPFTLEPVTPATVLLIDLENSADHVRRQLRPLLLSCDQSGRTVEPDMMYPLIVPDGLDLTDAADAAWLRERVAADQPQLLCIGPRYKMASGDPKEEEVARRIVGVLDDVRSRFGCAVVIEDHQPHAQDGTRVTRPIGSSLWMRWPEFGLSIANDGRLLRWRGAREQRAWPHRMQRGGTWPWSPAADRIEDLDPDPVEQSRELLAAHLQAGGDPSYRAMRGVLRNNGIKLGNDQFNPLRNQVLNDDEGSLL